MDHVTPSMGLPFDKNVRRLWSRIVGSVVGWRGVCEPAQRVAWRGSSTTTLPWRTGQRQRTASVDFVGRGLPMSGKLHQFWFGLPTYSGVAAAIS
jgi:hypothetical protein